MDVGGDLNRHAQGSELLFADLGSEAESQSIGPGSRFHSVSSSAPSVTQQRCIDDCAISGLTGEGTFFRGLQIGIQEVC
jgi:hypothetical protein